MRRWNVARQGLSDLVVVADRMTITDGGALIFWRGHDGQYADAIHVAYADGQWRSVEAIT
jgi:hypothetical protein